MPFLHGYDLTEAATEGVDFVAIMLLAAAGELPRRGQVEMMNGGQLHAEHRDNHTGVGQTAQRGHARGGPGARQGPHHGRRAVVRRCLGHHGVVPGYGHLMHTEGDLRAPLLFGLARSHGVAELERRCGRPIPLNATGAIAAVLSDLGGLWRSVVPWSVWPARSPVGAGTGRGGPGTPMAHGRVRARRRLRRPPATTDAQAVAALTHPHPRDDRTHTDGPQPTPLQRRR